MQGRLGRIIRYGVVAAIDAATLGAALFFSGCSQNNNPGVNNIKKDKTAVEQKERVYSDSRAGYEPTNSKAKPDSSVEVLVEGPELFDPRDNMGLKNLEQKVEVQEPARQYQPPAELVTLPPIRTPVQNPTVPAPLPTTPVYQVPQEPVAQPSQLPNYQTQPLQQIQTQRANDYQQPAPLPTTSNYQTQPLQQIQPVQPRGFQGFESQRSRY